MPRIIVASPRMRFVGDRNAPPDENRGVQAEMTVIRDLLHRDRATWQGKVRPVILPGGGIDGLPDFLAPYSLSRYDVSDLTVAGIETLLRLVSGQPKAVRPRLGQVPQLPSEPATPATRVASSEPDWRVLPEPADTEWRKAIMASGNQWTPEWSATLEFHLVPIGDFARVPASSLRAIGDSLSTALRRHGLVPESVGVSDRRDAHVVQAAWYDSRRALGAGLAVLRDGQRSAWQTLPKARIGNVLIPAEAVEVITTLLPILLGLGGTLPERFAPAIGIEPVKFVRIGERSDLERSSASLSMTSGEIIRIDADESVATDELLGSPRAVAEDLVERLVGAFPARSR